MKGFRWKLKDFIKEIKRLPKPGEILYLDDDAKGGAFEDIEEPEDFEYMELFSDIKELKTFGRETPEDADGLKVYLVVDIRKYKWKYQTDGLVTSI